MEWIRRFGYGHIQGMDKIWERTEPGIGQVQGGGQDQGGGQVQEVDRFKGWTGSGGGTG